MNVVFGKYNELEVDFLSKRVTNYYGDKEKIFVKRNDDREIFKNMEKEIVAVVMEIMPFSKEEIVTIHNYNNNEEIIIITDASIDAVMRLTITFHVVLKILDKQSPKNLNSYYYYRLHKG